MCRVYHARQNDIGIMAAFRSTGVRQHAETLHGIDPDLTVVEWHHFVDRSAHFTNSFRRHRDIVQSKNVVRLPSIYPKLISRAILLAPR